ncbi:MAG TPA: hypothetical protein VEO00_02840 [Actinomycetota bacterium]|nr:hypothetical protein [Actinomycetota bacterium]
MNGAPDRPTAGGGAGPDRGTVPLVTREERAASTEDRLSMLWERYADAQEEARRQAEANALLKAEIRVLREELARERAQLRAFVAAALAQQPVVLPDSEVVHPAGREADDAPQEPLGLTLRERLAIREREREEREREERERRPALQAARLEAEARRREALARRREETYGSPATDDSWTAAPGPRFRRRRR